MNEAANPTPVSVFADSVISGANVSIICSEILVRRWTFTSTIVVDAGLIIYLAYRTFSVHKAANGTLQIALAINAIYLDSTV